MMRYLLGEQLEELPAGGVHSPMEEWEERPAVVVVSSREAHAALEHTGMRFEGKIDLREVNFCKLESQAECLVGSLCIPKLLDVTDGRYRVMFLVNHKNIVLIDDTDFTYRQIQHIRRNRSNQGDTKERFLYNFLLEIISRDVSVLSQYEKRLMDLDEQVIHDKLYDFQSHFTRIRRELLVLRGYYDELVDFAEELEENENGFFAQKQLLYFGTITGRADRLLGKTGYLLEYAKQVQDGYQARVSAEQNSNMQFLTVLSTVFFPLTLITGWYGMNFQNMPELKSGYPFVIVLSILVVVLCVLIFKKKKMF